MLNLLSNVAILDVTNTTPTVVFLDNVMEGVDGAAVFGLSREAQAVQIQDNQTYQYAHTDTLDIRVLDTDNANVAILKSIVENQRPVQIAAISPNGVLSWNEASLLSYTDQFDVLQVNPIQATVTYPAGYSGGTTANSSTPVYAGDNLLGTYDVSTGNTALLNGFYQTAGLTLTQAGGYMNAVTTLGSIGVWTLTRPIPFPWKNQRVTASVLVQDYNNQTDQARVGVYWRNVDAYGGSSVSGTFQSNVSNIDDIITSAPERVNAEFVSPNDSNLFYASFVVYFGTGHVAGDYVNFAQPAITVGAQTAFTL